MLCPSQHTQVGFTVLTELAAVGLTVVPCANMKARPLQNMRLSLPQIAQLFARLKTKHSQRSRQNGLKFRTKWCQPHVFKKPPMQKLFINICTGSCTFKLNCGWGLNCSISASPLGLLCLRACLFFYHVPPFPSTLSVVSVQPCWPEVASLKELMRNSCKTTTSRSKGHRHDITTTSKCREHWGLSRQPWILKGKQ